MMASILLFFVPNVAYFCNQHNGFEHVANMEDRQSTVGACVTRLLLI